jgi:hypothetical protein
MVGLGGSDWYSAFQKFGARFRDKLLEKTISRRSFSVGGSSPIAQDFWRTLYLYEIFVLSSVVVFALSRYFLISLADLLK